MSATCEGTKPVISAMGLSSGFEGSLLVESACPAPVVGITLGVDLGLSAKIVILMRVDLLPNQLGALMFYLTLDMPQSDGHSGPAQAVAH